MEDLRILQAVHALPSDTYGGSELYTKEIAEALSERGHDVAVASPLGDGSEIDDAVEVFGLPATEPHPDADPASTPAEIARRHAAGEPVDEGRLFGPARGLVRPRVEAAFADAVETFEPDVVHFQHLKGLSARLPLCSPETARCLLTLHDFWTICEREQLVRPDGSRCSGPTSARKCAACFAAAVGDGDGARFLDATRWRRRRLAEVLADLDRLVAPSSFLARRFERFAPDAADIVRRRNGIPAHRFTDTGFDPTSPLRLGYAGRIAQTKGLHVLLEAFERAREADRAVELDVWGRFEPSQEPYHARLDQAAGEGVVFHGRYEDTATPYEAMDVFVLPSVWHENSPLVIQEAFAANVPVIASDIGGMAELVTDGTDGLTFAAGDAEALAREIQRLAADPSRVRRLRAGVRCPKTLDEHVDELEALYRDAPIARRLHTPSR